jgi:2-C-methyl-D-erythritol 4-phosphate cytidylyltransferase
MGGADKIFAPLLGKPVLLYSLSAFQEAKSADGIIVVSRPENADKIAALCRENKIDKFKAVVTGGESRALSVLNAVSTIGEEDGVIAVHDGARPLVTPALIDAVIAAAKEFKAAVLAVPARDTVKEAAGGFITGTPDRGRMFLAQTPQAFDLRLYREAAKTAPPDAADDGVVVESSGARVKIVAGDYRNIKITAKEDLTAAEALLCF